MRRVGSDDDIGISVEIRRSKIVVACWACDLGQLSRSEVAVGIAMPIS